ncbi:MAG: hypothetical protein ACOZF0_03780 [Thermodesulfobacteriota bacterium]
MNLTKKATFGIICGTLGALIGLGSTIYIQWQQERNAAPPSLVSTPLEVSMDSRGPYLILGTEKAVAAWEQAILAARNLHPGAEWMVFDPLRLQEVKERLARISARYAMVFIRPEELDVNLAWAWLRMVTEIDADPFVDVRTGFITGETPESVLRFVQRIERAANGAIRLPARFVDNLGPNSDMDRTDCATYPSNFMIPALGKRMALTSISHGTQGFTRDRLTLMQNAGLVHYGGHGYPDRIVDSLNGVFVRRIRFAPHIFFSGACYTGVTHTWFETDGGRIREKQVSPATSFALGVLGGEAVAYLAAVHPDHGIPVYQEMEYLAYSGASLGESMKYTHDGVVLAAGGKLPELNPLADGQPAPEMTAAEVMLNGTASRILFGDPALRAMAAFALPPFTISATPRAGGEIIIEAVLRNPDLKSTFTEAYYSDLSRTGQFNDRALVSCPLPKNNQVVRQIEIKSVTAGGKTIPSRLVGFGLETDQDGIYLHILLDLPSTGYQEGPIRVSDAKLILAARP